MYLDKWAIEHVLRYCAYMTRIAAETGTFSLWSRWQARHKAAWKLWELTRDK